MKRININEIKKEFLRLNNKFEDKSGEVEKRQSQLRADHNSMKQKHLKFSEQVNRRFKDYSK